MAALLNTNTNRMNNLINAYEANDPKRKSKKGFAQIVKDGRIMPLGSLAPDDVYEAMDDEVIVTSKVMSVKSIVSKS